jgi:hypothetical protein
VVAEIDMDSCCGSRLYHRRGADLEVVNCDDSEETVAALAPSLETRCISYTIE